MTQVSGFSAVVGRKGGWGGGLVAELQVVPALWVVFHCGSGVTGHVLHVFFLGT